MLAKQTVHYLEYQWPCSYWQVRTFRGFGDCKAYGLSVCVSMPCYKVHDKSAACAVLDVSDIWCPGAARFGPSRQVGEGVWLKVVLYKVLRSRNLYVTRRLARVGGKDIERVLYLEAAGIRKVAVDHWI